MTLRLATVALSALALAAPALAQQTSSKGYIEMPAPEDGSYVLTAKPGSGRNWGQPVFVRYLVMVAQEWKRRHPEGPVLRIGDMSKPDGTNFPPHKTHKDGLTADLFTSPKNACHVNFKDQELTAELAQLMVDLGARQILYNHPHVIQKVAIVQKYPKHDDHFHIVIDPSRVPKDGTVLVMPEPGRREGDWISANDLDEEKKGLELRWRVVGEPKVRGVRVLFDDLDDGNGILHDSGVQKLRAPGYRVPIALEHGQRYRWRVELDGEGKPGCKWQTLQTDLERPQVTALGPEDGAKLDWAPLLRWSYAKEGVAQARYWIELDGDRNHRKIAGTVGPFASASQRHPLDPPPKLRRNKKYFWRVVVADAHGNEGASEWRAFKTTSAFGKKERPGAPPEPQASGGGRRGTVSASALNLRSGPGTGNPVRATLQGGTEVKILGEQAGWLEVEALSGGETVRGFVSARYIKQ